MFMGALDSKSELEFNWHLHKKHSYIASHNLDEVFKRVQSKGLFEYFHQEAMKTSHGWMELMV